MSKPIPLILPSKPVKLLTVNWAYNRRLALSRELRTAIYNLHKTPQLKRRDFHTEALALLPELNKEIETYNAKQQKAAKEAIKRKPPVDSYKLAEAEVKVAMFGSEAQCEALVKTYLKI